MGPRIVTVSKAILDWLTAAAWPLRSQQIRLLPHAAAAYHGGGPPELTDWGPGPDEAQGDNESLAPRSETPGAIHWRKRLEWREICNSLYIGVLMVDRNGLVVFANSYLENMLDYPQGDLVGKEVEDLMPQRFRARHVALRDGYLKEKSPRIMARGVDLYCLTRHGEEIMVQIGLAPMNITEGTFVVATIWRQYSVEHAVRH